VSRLLDAVVEAFKVFTLSGEERRLPMRVLMQNRSNAMTHRGGDTVLMEQLAAELRKKGAEVTIDCGGRANARDFDIVHLFNFVLPELVEILGKRAKEAGVPFVVTSLCEDVPSFHNQSHAIAQNLIEYVQNGQNRQWMQRNSIDLTKIERKQGFNNAWSASNAHTIFVTGRAEEECIRRDFPDVRNVATVGVGWDLGREASPEPFVREFGHRDFVLCVGRLESRKNQLMLLKALEDSDLTVVLASGGVNYQPEYEKAVREFKRKGKTIILGELSVEMLSSAYAAAKVHVLPSWYELPGLVSLEAAAYGCNVVVTRNGTAPDFFEDRAFYCEPSDDNSILNAVTAAYYAPVKDGLKESALSHTWEAVAGRVFAEYQKAVPKQASNPASAIRLPGQIDAAELTTSETASDFQTALTQGEEAARNRNYSDAHLFLDKALTINTESVRALRAKGAVFVAQEDAANARQWFDAAYKLDRRDPKTLSGIGMCEMMSKRPETAYEFFVSALAINPAQMITILQLLECSYILNRFDDLEDVLKTYLAENPNDNEMKYCLAGCTYKRGRLNEAQRLCEEILQHDPAHLGSQQLLEVIAKGKTEDQSDTAKAEDGGYDEVDALLDSLEEEKRAKNLDKVQTALNELFATTSLSVEQAERATLIKAEALLLDGNAEESKAIYQTVLAQNASSARALCGMGAMAASMNEWEKAEELFREANNINPEYDVAHAGLGLCSSNEEEYDSAWGYYSQAVKLNPENSRALLGMIEIGYSMNRLDEVEAALKAYLDLHPADLNFLYSLAGCFYAQNRLQEAMSELEKIAIFDPNHKNAMELKETIESRMQEPTAAPDNRLSSFSS